MKLTILENKTCGFKDIPMFHTFLFGNQVFAKISGTEAIKISQNKICIFEAYFDVSPCVVEEMSVRKV